MTDAEPSSLVTSRLYAEGDLRAMYAIEEACFEPSVRFSRSLMRSLAHGPNCHTWLGTVDNVRVGFAIAGLRGEGNSGEGDSCLAYIWTIEVLPAFRRMGVARQLLMRVEESAREAGCAAVELHVSERNEGALAMYVASGFVQAGVEPEYYGRGEDAFRYRKVILERL
jgi:ribosomal-protein-alanine N-acetyltransferase